MKIEYPLKLKASKVFIQELGHAERGRYEDALAAREGNCEVRNMMEDDYHCVLGDFIDRWKTQIEVRNDTELRELYYALASGLIGLYGYSRQANKLLDRIRPRVQEIDPKIVKMFPFQNGF